jgi:hypothetical protein
MHQQLWGYKVEWKSVSRGTGGKKLNTTAVNYDAKKQWQASTDVLPSLEIKVFLKRHLQSFADL